MTKLDRIVAYMDAILKDVKVTIDDKLAEMLALAEKADAAPWKQIGEQIVGARDQTLAKCFGKTMTSKKEPRLVLNAEFIATARTDWPATVRSLQIAILHLENSPEFLGTALHAIAKELGCEE